MSDTPRSLAAARLPRAALRAAAGVLLVSRAAPPAAPPARGQPAAVASNPAEGDEPLVAVWDDGSITAWHGHVDLGTGLRTALGQIVAEELDAPPGAVHVVLGDTASAPNQGATIASSSIQVHAEPLRRAAAQARAWLVDQGGVRALAGRHVDLRLDPAARVKDPADYRVVGTSAPRVDLHDKATGAPVYVHDMRVPGMLHGRVVRPPYAGVDAGDFVGNTLESVDEGSIAHIAGIRAVVVIRDFVGVVAEREEQAEAAMRALVVRWKPWPGMPELDDLAHALRANPATRRVLADEGDVDQAIARSSHAFRREYVWPYQLHASIGPSCALADWRASPDGAAPRLTVWTGSQNPHVLRADLARLTGLDDIAIDVVRLEASGCYGRNGADDVAADATLLSRAVGAPVRVQLSREQEHLWEPKGAAQLMQVAGALGSDGEFAAYDFQTSYPSNGAPTLALLLTRAIEPDATAYEMGDRTAMPPYAVPNVRAVANDMPPILRASWLRGVSALPNSFAHESFVDELATAAGVDPVAYRLRHLQHDTRARELVAATAARAGWIAHTAPRQRPPAPGGLLQGQGFAYARYVHSKFPGYGAAWAAWVADVEVDRASGEVHVRRVVVGQDAGLMINPAGVQHQVHGNVLQTTSRALKESLRIDAATQTPAAREWGGYPILNFREVPVVDVLLMPRAGEPPLGAGESSSVPGTAAIANAIFDATGVRLRAPPFTPEVVRAALNPLPATANEGAAPSDDRDGASPADGEPAAATARGRPVAAARRMLPPDAPWPRARGWRRSAGALIAGAIGIGAAWLAALGLGAGVAGGRGAIAPVDARRTNVYSADVIERGRVLAALGDCVVCHTAPGGAPNAGGRAMPTPFGDVVSTNLTPDPATGIGRWSFSAFQRAMREGLSRDGHHLYPAFPYPSFTRMSDDELTALYAYLMAQPAVERRVPPTRLAFPFGWRPLMAAWNALHLRPGPRPADETRSAAWNRGAELVEGVGHCGACHTPRDALGAERGGRAHLAGAIVDGWEAPALTALNPAPLRWTEDDFYDYLRRGHSARHGTAGGPMAAVVRQLAAVPDDELRAMATYLASFGAPAGADDAQTRASDTVAAATAAAARPAGVDAAHRLFEGACGACHHDGSGAPMLGQNIALTLASKLHGDRPDNLLRVILEGVREPASAELGFMPSFRDALDDAQLVELAAYLRGRYAPAQPPWRDLREAVARVRAAPSVAHPR